jgi:hypothetical protein
MMKTLFAEILVGLGLSPAAAASHLDVPLEMVESWIAARQTPPLTVMRTLHDLADRQNLAASVAYELWQEDGSPPEAEFCVTTDDREAQQSGWPSAGAHAAAARRFWEMLPDEVKINTARPGRPN